MTSPHHTKKLKTLFSTNRTLESLLNEYQSLYTQTLVLEMQLGYLGVRQQQQQQGRNVIQQQQESNDSSDMSVMDDDDEDVRGNQQQQPELQSNTSSSSSSPFAFPTTSGASSSVSVTHTGNISSSVPQNFSTPFLTKVTNMYLNTHLMSPSLCTLMSQHIYPKVAQMSEMIHREFLLQISQYYENSKQEIKNVVRRMRLACSNESEKALLQEVMEVVKGECLERVKSNERRVMQQQQMVGNQQQQPMQQSGEMSPTTPLESPMMYDFSSSHALNEQKTSLQRDKATHYAYQALLSLRVENYTQAVKDATKAIEIDSQYAKAYHRRASALVAMRKFQDAGKDFQRILELNPDDLVAQQKLEACRKEAKRMQYEKSVMFTPTTPSENIRLGQIFDIAIAKSEGESMADIGINLDFIHEMIERFRGQKTIQKKYALYILVQGIKIFKAYESVYDLNVPDGKVITVCGDTHGQFYDLCRIFELNGYPSRENPYIFNGDFVDRGSFGCEVMFTLLAFKVWDPECIHLTRGNHEDRSMNEIFGFEGEVKHKYSEEIFEIFVELFNWLPLGIVLNQRIFIVHGGVGFERSEVNIDELRQIDRFRPCPDDGLMCHMLWSDPAPEDELGSLNNGLAPSDRGVSNFFGPEVLNRFLTANNLDLVIRSHELKDEGYEIQFGGRVCTIFSAPNYVDYSQNKGAFIIFRGNNLNNRQEALAPKFCKFTHSWHPPVKPMAYANMLYQEEDQ
mmetsp:Transcript_4862/g.18216  ORF Transcript_4862/g.18216 Transcript_4862/m.18216 type:complete len:738 (-) Transcript_4862:115-2328(-)|eukprot:CAMPEP_0117445306 /NCGR_PEP_ID=MMETSP0759-20121206/5722_1 /TAXON_ID=63605 /ORGANISM="Percolomonas cosmopolitus, Strain WS" /LENGTH=737 /DNA_ID=CAMNT_0005237467 /DNA_START=197 /DNA_END=2410 /DNA_ORIENTATION=+